MRTEIWRWIALAEQVGLHQFNHLSTTAFHMHQGHALMKAHRFDEAETALRALIETEHDLPAHRRLQAMSRCDLANCLRLRGETDNARVRLMLLEAHGSSCRHRRRRSIVPVLHVQDRVLDLQSCPLLTKILDHWDAWVAGESLADDADDYWGL